RDRCAKAGAIDILRKDLDGPTAVCDEEDLSELSTQFGERFVRPKGEIPGPGPGNRCAALDNHDGLTVPVGDLVTANALRALERCPLASEDMVARGIRSPGSPADR